MRGDTRTSRVAPEEPSSFAVSRLKPLSLRGRLLLLVALAMIPAFGMIVFSTWEDKAAAELRAQQQTRQLAMVVAEEQSRIVGEMRQLLGVLSSLGGMRDPALLPQCNETLARIRQQNALYANIGLVDARGKLLCSALPFKPPVDFSDRAWFQRAIDERGFAVGDYLVGKLSGVPSVGMGYPLYGAGGKLEGVLYATLDLAWMQNLAGRLPLPPGAVVVVVDAGGTVLLRYPDPERKWMGKPAPEKGELQTLLAQSCRGYAEFTGQDGVPRLNAIEPLLHKGGQCVYVRVGVPKDEVYGPIERNFLRNILAMLGVSLLAFAAAWFGSDWLVLRRVHAIGAAARRLGAGDLLARTGLPHDVEELGQLARGFDEMADGIAERENRIAEADRALRRTNRALTVLSAGNRAMLRAADEQSLLDETCRMVVEKGGYRMAWVGYPRADDARSIEPMAYFGFNAGRLDPRCLTWDESQGGISPVGAAVRSGRPEVFRVTPEGTILSCMEGVDCMALLSLPLSGEGGVGEVFGVLNIYAPEAGAFDGAEIELLNEAAADLAFGIGRLRDQARRREAEEANRIKSEFLANMSHELRTPLNAIIGFSDVLKDGLLGEMEPTQREYVVDIYQSGRHLLSLINDILDLSKVEAGKMALDLEGAEVASLLENSLSVIREKAAAHRIELREDLQENLEPIRVDPRKTKQIVYNLLSNALKFTPDGGRVALSARRATRGEVENWATDKPNGMRLPLSSNEFTEFLEISVVDTGIGIKPEDAPRLFQPFSQLDSSLSRRYEGTGLGLAMVMKMAQLHGGTVAVSSEPGKGSCFMVWLPWRYSATGTLEQDVLAPGGAMAGAEEGLALVVEDDDAAAELLRLQVEAEGLRVLREASAEAALALMGSRHPSVIILDILLPGMDGWDFLARCKEVGSPWAGVPVVIASVAADSQRGFSLGAAQVLQKPVSREEMAEALHRVGLGVPSGPARKVLIVDDDPKAVEILAAYLAEPGYTVLRAYGGREGIELARRERPDLMMLDLMMPEVSGFDVVEALKGEAATATIPIVVVTSKTLTAEERALLNGHVAAVMEKASFNHGRFATEVRRALMKTGAT